MVPAGNKAKHLSSVNHTTEPIYRHHPSSSSSSSSSSISIYRDYICKQILLTQEDNKFPECKCKNYCWKFGLNSLNFKVICLVKVDLHMVPFLNRSSYRLLSSFKQKGRVEQTGGWQINKQAKIINRKEGAINGEVGKNLQS